MKQPVILYRALDNADRAELDAITASGFRLIESRLDIHEGALVIGRYSVLPFYQEQERDVLRQKARLITSHRQHLYSQPQELVRGPQKVYSRDLVLS